MKEVFNYFRLKQTRANKIIEEVMSAVKYWKKDAAEACLSSTEQDRMARAFRIVSS